MIWNERKVNIMYAEKRFPGPSELWWSVGHNPFYLKTWPLNGMRPDSHAKWWELFTYKTFIAAWADKWPLVLQWEEHLGK